jgi:PAS domain S-box-containing protein
MVKIEYFIYGFLAASVLAVLISSLLHQHLIEKSSKSEQDLDTLKEELTNLEEERVELREQYEFMQEILDTSPSIIYMKNLRGQVLLVNNGFIRLFGGKKEDYLGKTEFEYLPVEIAKQYRDNDQKVVETGNILHIEEEAIDKEGKKRIYFSVKFPVRDKSGNIYAVSGISTDITDSKETEESLSLALATVGMGTYVWDMVRDTHYWSEQTKQLFGVEPTDGFNFESVLELIHPEDRERVGNKTQESISHGKDYTVEYRVKRPDGSYRWLSVRSRPFLDDMGRPMKLVGVCYDISDVKKNELRLKKALVARDEFLRLASHELKTPLSALKLQFQMTKRNLEKGETTVVSPESMNKVVDSGNAQVDRLIHTVEKILYEIRGES